MGTAISVDSLNYYYPDKQALCDVSFYIEKGSITALVGPNGAGKSTLLRLLAALDTPFSGQITVADVNVQEQPRQAHVKTGYLSDDFGLYDDLLVQDTLQYIGGCHNLERDVLASRLQWVTETLGLQNVLMQKCRTLSRGWRQRVGIALSILHKPEILILDEPASGLDPEARSDLSVVLKRLRDAGMTILVSSHILAELEDYCTAMLVLRDGKIQQHVSHFDAAQTQEVGRLRILLVSPLTKEQEDKVTAIPCNIVELSTDRSEMTVEIKGDRQAQHEILKTLMNAGIPVCGFRTEESSLQALYLKTAKTGEAS